jgi:prepilin-type N-terminal cleavage/methylation domain-containing protein
MGEPALLIVPHIAAFGGRGTKMDGLRKTHPHRNFICELSKGSYIFPSIIVPPTNSPMKQLRTHTAFTLIELLVVITIIGILAAGGFSAYTAAIRAGRLTASLQNAKQITTAMKLYANDNNGSFPTFVDPEAATQTLANANQAMESLMPKYFID